MDTNEDQIDDLIIPDDISSEPQDGIDDLKAQLAEREAQIKTEREGREAAQRRANELEHQANQSQAAQMQAREQLLAKDLEEKDRALADLQAKSEEALNNGDYKEAARINTEMANVAADKKMLERDKAAFTTHKKRIEEAAASEPMDVRERVLSKLTPASRDFMQQHPELLGDDGNVDGRALAAHNLALIERIEPDTPEYFDFLEQKLGYVETDDEPAPPPVRQPAPRRQTPSSAPVSRAGATARGGRQDVRLTPDELDAAEMLGMTPQEYAAEKVNQKPKQSQYAR